MLLCAPTCVLCLRGGTEDKGENEGAEAIWRKKGNGVVGVAERVENCNNNFLHCCMEEIGGFMNIMSREEPKDDVCLVQE